VVLLNRRSSERRVRASGDGLLSDRLEFDQLLRGCEVADVGGVERDATPEDDE
jgi:hypothetical protein